MNILDRIEEKISGLSKKQQLIGQYMLENKNKIGFMSLKEISKEIQVSEVTILNFCKRIEVDSFVQLKKEFQQVVQERLFLPNEICSSLEDLKSYKEAFENSINIHQENVAQILASNELSNLIQAAELICSSRRVVICGQGISKILAEYLQVRLRLLNLDARVLEMGDLISTSVELGSISKEDCFVLISFPEYSQSLIGISNFLSDREISYIALTDKQESPIAGKAECILECNSKALVFQNSISAPFFLLEVLMDTLSYHMKESLVTYFTKLDEVRDALSQELLPQL